VEIFNFKSVPDIKQSPGFKILGKRTLLLVETNDRNNKIVRCDGLPREPTSEMKHYEPFTLPPTYELSERKTRYSGRNFYTKNYRHTGSNHGLCPPNIIVNGKPLKCDTSEKFRGKLKDTGTGINRNTPKWPGKLEHKGTNAKETPDRLGRKGCR
jgi:hypothetical protein